jgi:hypothetical protein
MKMTILFIILIFPAFTLFANDTIVINVNSYKLLELDKTISNSDVIVIGELTNIESLWSDKYEMFFKVLLFKIDTVYKGEIQSNFIKVITGEIFDIDLIRLKKEYFKKKIFFLNYNNQNGMYYFTDVVQSTMELFEENEYIINICNMIHKDAYYKFVNNSDDLLVLSNEGYLKHYNPIGNWKYSEIFPVEDSLNDSLDKVITRNNNKYEKYERNIFYNDNSKLDSTLIELNKTDTVRIIKFNSGEKVQYIDFNNGKRISNNYNIDKDNYIDIEYDSNSKIVDSSKTTITKGDLMEYNSVIISPFTRWKKMEYIYKNDLIENNHLFYYPFYLNLKKIYDKKNKIVASGISFEENGRKEIQKKIGNHIYYNSEGQPIKIEEYDETGKLIRTFDVQTK